MLSGCIRREPHFRALGFAVVCVGVSLLPRWDISALIITRCAFPVIYSDGVTKKNQQRSSSMDNPRGRRLALPDALAGVHLIPIQEQLNVLLILQLQILRRENRIFERLDLLWCVSVCLFFLGGLSVP
ncbi:hypothetical protein NE237_000886 [Protea cynaroides]|uniref:Uncharacterized protein n=1 Tax=Protea cynaroides TaxID=273540 RepID=A0A9Q0QXX5_9MAGN|nr:hypothetical protein NE237_000886 [Protea cynaroides]